MNKTALAWCAGFIDAEGCLAARFSPKNDIRSVAITLDVSGTNLESINFLKETFKKGNTYTIKHSYKKDIYTWKIYGQDVYFCLKKILPFLATKKLQAKTLLTLQKITDQQGSKRPYTKEFLAKRKKLVDRMANLNLRGYQASILKKKEIIKVNSTMNTINDLSCAWAAGFIDGDGSISFLKTKQYGTFKGRMRAYNTHKSALETLQNLFGGTIVQVRQGSEDNHRQNLYIWDKCGKKDLIPLLEKLIPFFIIKKDRAVLLLGAYTDKIDKTKAQEQILYLNKSLGQGRQR